MQHQYPSLQTSHSSECHSVKGCDCLSGNDPRDTSRRSTFYDEDQGEAVDLSGHGTWANGDLLEIIQHLVEALSLLQAMSKGHEVRMATIVRALLQTSQDQESGVSERLQYLESSARHSTPLSHWMEPWSGLGSQCVVTKSLRMYLHARPTCCFCGFATST